MKRISKEIEKLETEAVSRFHPAVSPVVAGAALTKFNEMKLLEYNPSRKFLRGILDTDKMEELKRDLMGYLEAEDDISGPDTSS
jgi:hypothetical protein